MKFREMVLFIGMLAAVPQAAAAAVDFDPATLGHMKAVLEICGGVDRQAATQYLLQMKAMIGAATRQQIVKLSKSRSYQDAYQSVRSELSSRSPQELAVSCRSYLAEGR